MNLYFNYEILFLLLSAIDNVIGSKYSISAPIGIPYAILDTRTFVLSNNLEIYNAVVSPSNVGLIAIITSFISLFLTLFTSEFISISFGPFPFIGDIRPFNTWYLPLKLPIFSNVIIFLESSTTHIIESSLYSFVHILHLSLSVIFPHIEQFFIFDLTSNIEIENKNLNAIDSIVDIFGSDLVEMEGW